MSRIDARRASPSTSAASLAQLPEVGELRATESTLADSSPAELALLALAPSLAEPSVDPVSVPSARAILALVQAADRFTADPSAPAEVRDAMRTVRHLLVLRDEVAGRRRGSVTP